MTREEPFLRIRSLLAILLIIGMLVSFIPIAISTTPAKAAAGVDISWL